MKRSYGYIVTECCITFVGHLASNVMYRGMKRISSCIVSERYNNRIDYSTTNLMVDFTSETHFHLVMLLNAVSYA